MADYDVDGTPVGDDKLDGARSWCHVMYGLHALSALSGILSSASIVGAFVFGWPSIIAVIINYATRGQVRGTWLDSHWRWQLRTFWWALLLGVSALLLTWVLVISIVGLLIYWLPLAVVGIWVLYRVIRGWLALADRRALPVPPA